MSSPDRPCAQGFGTMRRLRQMRFPLGIDQDSAKNCYSRVTTRTWKRRTFARASGMRLTLWLLRTAAWQQRNEVLDPLCGWRVGPQETTLDDSEGAVVAECCSFLVFSAP